FQVSAPISPGSSGSPVLNVNGEVIGIAVSKWRGGENLNFAVPINYARGLISLAPGTPASSPIIPTRAVGTDATSLSGIWKSLVSGNEMEIREDGDRLYVEFIYSAEERQLGRMSIYDLKRPTTGVNTYTGTFRTGGYCKDYAGRPVSRF